jgi:hypothetical protein
MAVPKSFSHYTFDKEDPPKKEPPRSAGYAAAGCEAAHKAKPLEKPDKSSVEDLIDWIEVRRTQYVVRIPTDWRLNITYPYPLKPPVTQELKVAPSTVTGASTCLGVVSPRRGARVGSLL